MRILIIEDRPEITKLLRRYLEPFSDKIEEANTWEDAKDMLKKSNVLDLITVDLGLPDSRPEETIAKLPTLRDHHKNAIVIVISGVCTREDESRVLQAGADGFFLKAEIPDQLTLLQRMAQIIRSICKSPDRFRRHLVGAELMATRFLEYVESQAPTWPK